MRKANPISKRLTIIKALYGKTQNKQLTKEIHQNNFKGRLKVAKHGTFFF